MIDELKKTIQKDGILHSRHKKMAKDANKQQEKASWSVFE